MPDQPNGEERHLDEPLSPEDEARLVDVIQPQDFESGDYDDTPLGDVELSDDSDDEVVEDDDGEDEAEADFSADEELTEAVDYGESEDVEDE